MTGYKHDRVQHEAPEKGQKTYQLKHCDYYNKDEVNSPHILSKNNFIVSCNINFLNANVVQNHFKQVNASYLGAISNI